MSDIERITITVTSTMAGDIRSAIEDGEYASTSEVMRDALRLWAARREVRANDIKMLQQRWDAAKASGPVHELDPQRILANAKSRLRGGNDA